MTFQAIQAMEPVKSSPQQSRNDEDDFFVEILNNPKYEGLSNEDKRLLAAEAALD